MKNVLLFLSLVLVFSLPVWGVGSSQSSSPGASGPVKLTFMTSVNVDTEGFEINDSPYVKFVNQKFNVELNYISEVTTVNYYQKLNTTIASGNLPDYFMLYSKNDVARWASEGVIMNLDPLVEKAPVLKEQIMPLAWNLCSYDGKKYAIPLLRYDKTPLNMFVRKDYLQNLGIAPESVKTIDDWYNMLKAMTFNDPNRNGKNDTYGITIDDKSRLPFLDAFNAATAQVVNGEVIPYFLTDGYKNWLKWFARLYGEGIMDPTYLVSAGAPLWDKIVEGTICSFQYFWTTTELRSKNFDVEKLVAVDPPLKPNGSASFNKYGSPIRNFTVISNKTKNAAKIIEILNWANSEEGSVYTLAGVEGRDYTKSSNGSITINQDRRGKNNSLRFIILGSQRPNIDTPLLKDLLSQNFGTTGLSFLQKADKFGGYDEVDMLTPFFPQLSAYDLDSPVDQFRDLAIMGKVNIDTEWPNYVARWRNAGGNDKIRLTTDWYNKSYKK